MGDEALREGLGEALALGEPRALAGAGALGLGDGAVFGAALSWELSPFSSDTSINATTSLKSALLLISCLRTKPKATTFGGNFRDFCGVVDACGSGRSACSFCGPGTA